MSLCCQEFSNEVTGLVMMFSSVFILLPLLASMVRLSSQSSKDEGACSKAEKLQRTFREKTPIGMLTF